MPGSITVFLLEVDEVPYVDAGPGGESQNLNTKQTDKTVKPGTRARSDYTLRA